MSAKPSSAAHIAALVRFAIDYPHWPTVHGSPIKYRTAAGDWEPITSDNAPAIAAELAQANANAYAERWVRTLRHELLDRTIIWNDKQLRALLVEYIEHYNQHRPHRGIDQRAPNDTADAVPIRQGQRIERRTACGGLINEYRTAA